MRSARKRSRIEITTHLSARLVPIWQAPKVRRFSTIFGACQSGRGVLERAEKKRGCQKSKTPYLSRLSTLATRRKRAQVELRVCSRRLWRHVFNVPI